MFRKFAVGKRDQLSTTELKRLNRCYRGQKCSECHNCRAVLAGYAVKQLLEQHKQAEKMKRAHQRAVKSGKLTMIR